MKAFICSLLALLYTLPAAAQWQLQDSGTTASFRGVHAVSDTVAWVSGTNGTILRTTDGGAHWLRCSTPPGADKLDFRGIWAWDANTAEAMSAGPGDQSRLYKTTDGCKSWTQLLVNEKKDGFWDSFAYSTVTREGSKQPVLIGVLIGDPLNGRFDTRRIFGGPRWFDPPERCSANAGEAAFAASNSSLFVLKPGQYMIVTGGKGGPRALRSPDWGTNHIRFDSIEECLAAPLPLASGADSAGAFSVSFRDAKHGVVVGGDYKKPNETSGTAAWTSDGGKTWKPATKMPHGYRSSVAWDPRAKVWIAAGTNGSDISRDDGKTWTHLDDGDWNALSPPFVVGPSGRIAKLKTGATKR
jgi:photosystem II stability/assembly factor-like uncharacterized protein